MDSKCHHYQRFLVLWDLAGSEMHQFEEGWVVELVPVYLLLLLVGPGCGLVELGWHCGLKSYVMGVIYNVGWSLINYIRLRGINENNSCDIDLLLVNNILYCYIHNFHPNPETMDQPPLSFLPTQYPLHESRPQYNQIKKLLQQYKRVIQQKYESNEFLLIQQLQQKTLKLKQEIAFYKKQTSNESIEKMIAQRRHQKEAQRLQLQVHWRNLTEKYKKLQEEEKIINQHNAQSKFDIDNLERKIQQLKEANKSMAHRIQKLKASENSQQFMTEVNTSYTSPYKFKPLTNESLLWPLEKNLTKTSANFRLKLEQKKKNNLTLSKQNQFKIKLPEKLPSNNPSLQKKKDQLVKRQEELEKQNLTKLYTYQECTKKGKTTKLAFSRQQKWSELMYYLNKPQVRDKIFDLLRKEFHLYDANE